MSDSITTDGLAYAAGELAKMIEEQLVNGLMDKNLIFEHYREKTEQHVRSTLEHAPPGGIFAEVLQSVLDDKEEWKDA